MLQFKIKAEPKVKNILKNYDYVKVTPLKFINEWGDCEEKEPIKCTNVEQVKKLYYQEDDIMIQTPCGNNY